MSYQENEAGSSREFAYPPIESLVHPLSLKETSEHINKSVNPGIIIIGMLGAFTELGIMINIPQEGITDLHLTSPGTGKEATLDVWNIEDQTSEVTADFLEKGVPAPDPYGIRLSPLETPYTMKLATVNRANPQERFRVYIRNDDEMLGTSLDFKDSQLVSMTISNIDVVLMKKIRFDYSFDNLNSITFTQSISTLDPVIVRLIGLQSALKIYQDSLNPSIDKASQVYLPEKTQTRIQVGILRVASSLDYQIPENELKELMEMINSGTTNITAVTEFLFRKSRKGEETNQYLSWLLNNVIPTTEEFLIAELSLKSEINEENDEPDEFYPPKIKFSPTAKQLVDQFQKNIDAIDKSEKQDLMNLGNGIVGNLDYEVYHIISLLKNGVNILNR